MWLSHIQKLDAHLRSPSSLDRSTAICRVPEVVSRFPYPQVTNQCLLRLAGVYSSLRCSNHDRYLILHTIQQLVNTTIHPSKSGSGLVVRDKVEIVDKISNVLDMNDPIARTLTLKVLALLSPLTPNATSKVQRHFLDLTSFTSSSTSCASFDPHEFESEMCSLAECVGSMCRTCGKRRNGTLFGTSASASASAPSSIARLGQSETGTATPADELSVGFAHRIFPRLRSTIFEVSLVMSVRLSWLRVLKYLSLSSGGGRVSEETADGTAAPTPTLLNRTIRLLRDVQVAFPCAAVKEVVFECLEFMGINSVMRCAGHVIGILGIEIESWSGSGSRRDTDSILELQQPQLQLSPSGAEQQSAIQVSEGVRERVWIAAVESLRRVVMGVSGFHVAENLKIDVWDLLRRLQSEPSNGELQVLSRLIIELARHAAVVERLWRIGIPEQRSMITLALRPLLRRTEFWTSEAPIRKESVVGLHCQNVAILAFRVLFEMFCSGFDLQVRRTLAEDCVFALCTQLQAGRASGCMTSSLWICFGKACVVLLRRLLQMKPPLIDLSRLLIVTVIETLSSLVASPHCNLRVGFALVGTLERVLPFCSPDLKESVRDKLPFPVVVEWAVGRGSSENSLLPRFLKSLFRVVFGVSRGVAQEPLIASLCHRSMEPILANPELRWCSYEIITVGLSSGHCCLVSESLSLLRKTLASSSRPEFYYWIDSLWRWADAEASLVREDGCLLQLLTSVLCSLTRAESCLESWEQEQILLEKQTSHRELRTQASSRIVDSCRPGSSFQLRFLRLRTDWIRLLRRILHLDDIEIVVKTARHLSSDFRALSKSFFEIDRNSLLLLKQYADRLDHLASLSLEKEYHAYRSFESQESCLGQLIGISDRFVIPPFYFRTGRRVSVSLLLQVNEVRISSFDPKKSQSGHDRSSRMRTIVRVIRGVACTCFLEGFIIRTVSSSRRRQIHRVQIDLVAGQGRERRILRRFVSLVDAELRFRCQGIVRFGNFMMNDRLSVLVTVALIDREGVLWNTAYRKIVRLEFQD